ncbi:MAG TPA: class I SAM-dependent methyltransferase [Rhizomicrobium sp.]|nr:class I SAM-dependent methyltransferase [Rhizomicrobium sp.]
MHIFRFLRSADDRRSLLARMPKNAVAAEIGVWRGDFSARILKETHPRELHLVDPWAFVAEMPTRWYGGLKAKSQADMDAIHSGVARRFAAAPAVRIQRMTSLDAAATFADGTFDWVYIDGDHSYEAVRADLEAWAPKMKKGGFIAGDDYIWPDETGAQPVKRAVDEFAASSKRRLDVLRSQFIVEA